ncbi:hypothetical protein LR013_02730 [candidate division NPL-UPA2 bacterium]|nr:hypothetical protein [candidate division NPL-UPA2 bacterium]
MKKWNKIKAMDKKALTDWQLRELKNFLSSEVMERHPYYSRLFKERGFRPEDINSLDGLQTLPFTDLKDLKKPQGGRLFRFMLAPLRETDEKKPAKKKSFFDKLFRKKNNGATANSKDYQLSQVFYIGDFTSAPIPLVITAYDTERIKEAGRRLFDLWKLDRDNTIVNALSYGPNLAFWQVFYAGLELGSTVLQTGGGRVLGIERILTAMENMEAEVLFASPLYACIILQAAIKFKVKIESLTTIVLGGVESPSQEMALRLKELMTLARTRGTRVIRSFSLTEAKTGWGECPEGNGYHFHPDLHHIEIIDPVSGKKLQENESGEIVLTHLDTRGTCLIRYRTGLLITEGITFSPCSACGSSLPRLKGEIESRKNIIKLRTEKREEKVINLEKLARRLDKVKNLLLWQGIVKNNKNPSLTIYSSWLNKDDTCASSLKEEISESIGLKVNFVQESYENIMDRLKLETAFTPHRWTVETGLI